MKTIITSAFVIIYHDIYECIPSLTHPLSHCSIAILCLCCWYCLQLFWLQFIRLLNIMDKHSNKSKKKHTFLKRLKKKRARHISLTDQEPSALWHIDNTDVDYHMSKLVPGQKFNFASTLPQPKSRKLVWLFLYILFFWYVFL